MLFEAVSQGSSSPRRLANLIYRPPVLMNLDEGSATRRVSAAALICRAQDRLLHEHFYRLAEAIFGAAEARPLSEAEIEQRLDGFIALLSALRAPGRRAAQGLWSELAMIVWSRDVGRAIDAWHPSPNDLHDFAWGSQSLELKSTSGDGRVHDVGLDQLTQDGKRVVLASMKVQLHDEGRSLGEFVERALERLSGDSDRRQKLLRVVYESLGRDWESGTSVRIVERAAWQSLVYFRSDKVPSVARPIPLEVSGVRFTVDLSAVDSSSADEIRDLGEWWDAMMPVEANVR